MAGATFQGADGDYQTVLESINYPTRDRTPSLSSVRSALEGLVHGPHQAAADGATGIDRQADMGAEGGGSQDAHKEGEEGEEEVDDDGSEPDDKPPAGQRGQRVQGRFDPLSRSPKPKRGLPPASQSDAHAQTLGAAATDLNSGYTAEPPKPSSTRRTTETLVDSTSAPPTTDGLPTSSGDGDGSNPFSKPSIGRPGSRFRTSAAKVLQMHRGSTAIQSPGAEQGVDPRRDSAVAHWSHIHQECAIEVCDYSGVNVRFTPLNNARLEDFLNGNGHDRPHWAKVRWINVGGISWDVVRALALRYDLHPLATEDVLRCGEDGNRSKGEYFANHLFLSIISHSLAPDDRSSLDDESSVGEPSHPSGAVEGTRDPSMQASHGFRERLSAIRVERPVSRDDIESTLNKSNIVGRVDDKLTSGFVSQQDRPSARPLLVNTGPSRRRNRSPVVGTSHVNQEAEWDAPHGKADGAKKRTKEKQWVNWMDTSALVRRKAANQVLLEQLKKGSHVSVGLKHNYVFLTRGGTLITFCQDADLSVFEPIKERLRIKDSLLRQSCDASLLMESVLDLVVDKILEIVERYHDELLELERKIFINPSMESVRQLHIISGDLTLHKRTLTPLSTLVYTLRRYDLDRAVAATPGAQDGKDVQVTGYCSHQCKVYLADVYDHMDYILGSMDMFSSIAENLIDFAFNTVSYETNDVMRRLTIATVLFFPLTILTGYFGMNFHVTNWKPWSDIVYWELAIPIVAVTTLFLTYRDLIKMYYAFVSKQRFDHVQEKLKFSGSR
ncbi:hypothetical protein CALVIDRAFT_600322 [Calocera viscosa TUFC12733]|uniref:Cora-domain-containing protein n=1 Tax=Calocera viscosa (strain TUFC12733) TaxID=1330018 RepID=A0A167K019_CALVF|nr:hypothetical protein CALVIDRAFT_600322 [Calocera viscosa TUFC12733]